MSILTRTIITSILLIFPVFATAYPATDNKTEPIAQVYEVKGRVTLQSPTDGNTVEVKKGYLLGRDDVLALEKNAAISLYFKTGGKKEVPAEDTLVSYKVADLIPKAEAYSQEVPWFGAARSIEPPGIISLFPKFFYPQEAIIIDTSPLIEFTLFNGSGETIALGEARLQVLKSSAVLDSKKFANPQYDVPYLYQPPQLNAQTEYSVELNVDLQKDTLAISFPLYITGISDVALGSRYAPFSDRVYHSLEGTSMEYQNKQLKVTLIKQLARRGTSGSPQPVIVIEVFIT